MRKKDLSRVITFVAIMAVLALAAAFAMSCGSSNSGSSSGSSSGSTGGGTIKIGTLYPVTGELAKLGQECVNGVKMAVEEINAAGGIKSMGGAKIELVEADSQGKPDVGISEVQRLGDQEKVAAIIGTYQSSVAIPATQAAERLKVPIVISMAVADQITERGYKYVFRLCPKADYYAKNQLEVAKAMPQIAPAYQPIKRIALLHEDTDFGQSTAVGQRKYIKDMGFTLAGEVAYPSSAADLTTQVSKIKSMNPDIVLTTTYLNDAILIAQAKEKLGMKQLFFDASGGTIDPEFVKRLGPAAENIMTEMEFTKFGGPVAKDFAAKFSAAYGNDPTGNGAYGYQAMYVVAKALEVGASADRVKLRDSLATVKVDEAAGDRDVLPTPVIQFGPDGQNMFPALYSMQIQGGEPRPFFPAAYADVKLKF
jgi:branched-chain amino acid transport system substrate-binding protein